MSQQVTQNVSTSIIVLLYDATTSAPKTGVVFTDVTCSFSKNAAPFVPKTLTISNFIEIGLGVYNIVFTAADLNTLGTFIVVVNGALIQQSTTVAQVVVSAPSSLPVSIPTCTITGHIVDLQGFPVFDTVISARVTAFPTTMNFGLFGVGFGDSIVSSKTDSNGAFSLALAQNVEVDVTIPAINYRRTLVVPGSASAELFDIP